MKRAPDYWQQRGVLAVCWWAFSWFYWAMVRLRIARIKPQRMNVPVICVGNNTVGGTGKTPTVLWLCKQLQKHGFKPHVISRGYGGQYGGVVRVDPQVHIAQEVGDEPLLIARHATCWVARRRVQAARMAVGNGADIIIMDDGLQNPTLHKDFSILVCDGAYGIGNGWMLPAGPCREPFAVSCRKANGMVIIGEPIQPRLMQRTKQCAVPLFHARLVPDASLHLEGKNVHAFAGIGHPDKFFETVKNLGAHIMLTSYFPDHHIYSTTDMARLKKEATQYDAQLVTTEKDAVKLPPEFLSHVIVVPVALSVQQGDMLLQHILDVIALPNMAEAT